MYIISYDVASKSLALSIIYFNDNWEFDLKIIKEEYDETYQNCQTAEEICRCALKYLDLIDNLFDNLIVPKFFDVVDLIPGQKLKDVDVVTRAARLNTYLRMIDYDYIPGHRFPDPDSECPPIFVCDEAQKYKVLLEYQMGPNDKSRNVCSQILYHYSNIDANFSHSDEQSDSRKSMSNMKPTIKYDIEIIGPSLKNKLNLIKDKPHSYFIQKYTKTYDANKAHSKANFLYWIKKKNVENMIKNIKKKNLDDIADSVNMTLAWLFLKSNLINPN